MLEREESFVEHEDGMFGGVRWFEALFYFRLAQVHDDSALDSEVAVEETTVGHDAVVETVGYLQVESTVGTELGTG